MSKNITSIQVVVASEDDGVKSLQAVDIPVRDQDNASIEMHNDEYGVSLKLYVRNDKNYSTTYVMRDERVADAEGQLPPYLDGIFSTQDVAGKVAAALHGPRIEIDILEKKVARRDASLRKVRKELRELKKEKS